MESPNTAPQTRKTRMLFASGLLALLAIFAFVQFMAADDDPRPTPTPEKATPYDNRVDSIQELEAQAPSLERYVAGHAITGAQLLGADISDASKTVSRDEVSAGGFVEFLITVPNAGDTDATVTVTDDLPAQVSYLSHEVAVDSAFTLEEGEENGVVTWRGAIGPGGSVELRVRAMVDESVVPGTTVRNTAEITTGSETLTRSAQFSVTEVAISPVARLPFIIYGFNPEPPDVTVSATRPNSANAWTVSWTGGPTADGYELQVSQQPNFANAQTIDMGTATSRGFNPQPTFYNLYFYRVRSYDAGVFGEWSSPVRVVGGYRDDFDNPNSGWEVRRTTFIEEVQSFYEIRNGDDWLILRVEDSWDWGIASPLLPAPEPPYVIEFEAKHANLGNLVSLGGVFGGDKPGDTCPDKSSAAGWYEHDLCFNEFYNTNTIFFGDLKMLFERVDELVWCPNCGGSPMKRLGDIDPKGAVNLNGVSPEDWNHFRIEVREGNIKVFVGSRGRPLNLAKEYNDTRYIDNPYFGVFASTDEYSNSTARFEYFQVMPLD